MLVWVSLLNALSVKRHDDSRSCECSSHLSKKLTKLQLPVGLAKGSHCAQSAKRHRHDGGTLAEMTFRCTEQNYRERVARVGAANRRCGTRGRSRPFPSPTGRLGLSAPPSVHKCATTDAELNFEESEMQFRLATLQDVPVVAGVLSAAATHLRAKGLDLWSPSEVSESVISPHVKDGLYHIGFDGLEAVGVFRLQTRDPIFWPEIAEGTSAYLHKLAVHPAKQGQRFAHMLLRHAVELTWERGLNFLRLDCKGGLHVRHEQGRGQGNESS